MSAKNGTDREIQLFSLIFVSLMMGMGIAVIQGRQNQAIAAPLLSAPSLGGPTPGTFPTLLIPSIPLPVSSPVPSVLVPSLTLPPASPVPSVVIPSIGLPSPSPVPSVVIPSLNLPDTNSFAVDYPALTNSYPIN